MQTGDIVRGDSRDVDVRIHELALVKQLIKEQAHPLDLVRELLSNAAAEQVGATEIAIEYTIGATGHEFIIADDGCGMTYTGDQQHPGRLDRFLGLSGIVGLASDEFSWKGLGSKLAFQSRAVEVETWDGDSVSYRVDINEPWSSIDRGLVPHPRLTEYPGGSGRATRGTRIRVVGHPPWGEKMPFSLESIQDYLQHRTFVGFTRARANAPRIRLTVLGQTRELPVGFPELVQRYAGPQTLYVDEQQAVRSESGSASVCAHLTGFVTWDDRGHGLARGRQNTGLILSVRGIPYFDLDMGEYGSRSIATANPGRDKCCLVVECDAIQEEMNISRSGLVNAERTELLKAAVRKMVEKIESSRPYLAFRQVPKQRKLVETADLLNTRKQALEGPTQPWVVYTPSGDGPPTVLCREPENGNDVLALLWKLEALGGLPLSQFQTLGHMGTGPDLVVHFREDETSGPERYACVEVENRFNNYKAHGHAPSQHVRVVCWDLGTSRKIPVSGTGRRYKFTARKDDYQIHIYCLRHVDGVSVRTREQLAELGVAL